jgi:ATP-dependent DNA helicase HFM1/MER3
MIGRAGRPQFDDSSTAVIMTKRSAKKKYENIMSGTQTIESSLHKHLIEHLNAEIVLRTINDVTVALQWLKSTFLFTRIQKNPKHYGTSSGVLMARKTRSMK